MLIRRLLPGASCRLPSWMPGVSRTLRAIFSGAGGRWGQALFVGAPGLEKKGILKEFFGPSKCLIIMSLIILLPLFVSTHFRRGSALALRLGWVVPSLLLNTY